MATLRQTWLNNQSREAERVKINESIDKDQKEKLRYEEFMRRDDRVEKKRMLRVLQQQHDEEELMESLRQREEAKRARETAIRQEEQLALQLEKLRVMSTRDEKMRQQVRENSEEIKELEKKLRAAYISKERQAQIAEKKALAYDKLVQEAERVRIAQIEIEKADKEKALIEVTRANSKVRYQEALDSQLVEKEEQRKRAYEEFLHEKEMIDEIVRKIYEEDQKEQELGLMKKKATQHYIREFKALREQWKEEEKRNIAEENKRILAFMTMQEKREAGLSEEKKAREAAIERLQQKLSLEMEKKERERNEMEEIRQELALEEEERKARRHDRNEMEKRIRQRLELQRDQENQRCIKAEQRRREVDEENAYKEQLLQQFAEQEKLEQMNAQKRRMKQLEHKRTVEGLLEQRRKDIEVAKLAADDDVLYERQLDEIRRAIIEEERQKLLKEHAYKLLGYLPKGVIRDERDLALLGEDFMKEYERRGLDYDNDDEEMWKTFHNNRH